MKTILSIIIALFLFGCAATKLPDAPIIPPTKVINIDSDALTPCAELSENVNIVTFEDVLLAYGDLSTAYGACAKRQTISIKLIKQLGNVK